MTEREYLNGFNRSLNELPLHHPDRIIADCKAVLANSDVFLFDVPAVEVAWHCLHLLRLLGVEKAAEELARPWTEPVTDDKRGRRIKWTPEMDKVVLSMTPHLAADRLGCHHKTAEKRRAVLLGEAAA